MAQTIHFWDMDHTIINNDCDVSWKEFMIFKGLAGLEARDEADRFYQDYINMNLDIDNFLQFQLREFKGNSPEHMKALCFEHFKALVEDKIYSQAREMISSQIANGEMVCLLTATNRFIAEPLADFLNIPHVLATELELKGGIFTGRHEGVYCCAEGKLEHIKSFLNQHGGSLQESAYYGDSSNDIAVLEKVGKPFAANPGSKLEEKALQEGWTILRF